MKIITTENKQTIIYLSKISLSFIRNNAKELGINIPSDSFTNQESNDFVKITDKSLVEQIKSLNYIPEYQKIMKLNINQLQEEIAWCTDAIVEYTNNYIGDDNRETINTEMEKMQHLVIQLTHVKRAKLGEETIKVPPIPVTIVRTNQKTYTLSTSLEETCYLLSRLDEIPLSIEDKKAILWAEQEIEQIEKTKGTQNFTIEYEGFSENRRHFTFKIKQKKQTKTQKIMQLLSRKKTK